MSADNGCPISVMYLKRNNIRIIHDTKNNEYYMPPSSLKKSIIHNNINNDTIRLWYYQLKGFCEREQEHDMFIKNLSMFAQFIQSLKKLPHEMKQQITCYDECLNVSRNSYMVLFGI